MHAGLKRRGAKRRRERILLGWILLINFLFVQGALKPCFIPSGLSGSAFVANAATAMEWLPGHRKGAGQFNKKKADRPLTIGDGGALERPG